MASVPNRPYPDREHSHIITTTLEATDVKVTNVTGSALKVYGASGSIDFGSLYGTETGSAVENVYLKVNITGSDYLIALWAPA